MSFKRRVLSALGKDLLLQIGRGLELEVTARMRVDELREVLAGSKRARLEVIVQESLPRDTLKEICGAVGLDDTGKEKAALVERILAAGGVTTAADGDDPVAPPASGAIGGGYTIAASLLPAFPSTRGQGAR
jgi:type I restriction enzyme M protein